MMRSAFRSLVLRTLVSMAAFAAGSGFSGGAGAVEPPDPPAAAAPAAMPADAEAQAEARAVAIAKRLAAPGPLVIDGQVLRNLDTLRQTYARRGFVPTWTEAAGGGVRPVAAVPAMRAAFAESAADGLEPTHYHMTAITARLVAADPAGIAELDLLLTDAVVEYAVDLRGGRLAPRSIDPEMAIVPRPIDPVRLALDAMATPDMSRFLAGFTPPHPEYAALKRALALLRDKARAGGWPLPGPGPVLKLGMDDPNVPLVRRRLAATGDYAGPRTDQTRYDDALATAVRHFQHRHGLDLDGSVGVATRVALNIPVERRIEQVVANMERWRWLPDDLGDRYVWVNIPAFVLHAVDHGKVVLSMPVIVGQTERHTPMLASRIGQVVFNPTWAVPLSIAKKDILPKLARNPHYLSDQGITVTETVDGVTRTINPGAVDWRRIGDRMTRYRLRQQPGPRNALGRVKFLFPNDFNVYLHDTPGRDKFSKVVRTLSSGCVRLGSPSALADFVFAGRPDWTAGRWQQLMDAGETRSLTPQRPVPVYLFYQTAWLDETGAFQFREDIYDRDQQVLNALHKRLPQPQRVAVLP